MTAVVPFDEVQREYEKRKREAEAADFKECVANFNRTLLEAVGVLARAGSPISDLVCDFKLEPYGIVAPSAKLDALIHILTRDRQWCVSVLKQDVGELGLPSAINLAPVLRVTRFSRPASPFHFPSDKE